MAITYTQSWQSGFNESGESKIRTRQLFVVAEDGEVLTPLTVPTATHKTTGAPFPAVNDVYPGDSTYRLHNISLPQVAGPRAATVVLTYQVGVALDTDDENTPVRYRVRNGVTSETTDADVNGNALVNSAGEPFSGTVQTSVAAIFIDVIRVESAYNLPQAIAFTNKINADTFTLAGYPINPGEAYCLGIQPEGDYSLGDETVSVVYSFEIRDRLTLAGGDRATSFIHRILDQGKRAWTYADQLVPMYSKSGATDIDISPVTSDVLLNDGIPLEEDSYTNPDTEFGSDGQAWANAVNRAPNAVRDGAAPAPAFLLYEKHQTANFGTLNLG